MKHATLHNLNTWKIRHKPSHFVTILLATIFIDKYSVQKHTLSRKRRKELRPHSTTIFAPFLIHLLWLWNSSQMFAPQVTLSHCGPKNAVKYHSVESLRYCPRDKKRRLYPFAEIAEKPRSRATKWYRIWPAANELRAVERWSPEPSACPVNLKNS